jgi:hypothetical protein
VAKAQGDAPEVTKISKTLEAIDPDFAETYNIDLGLVAVAEP